MLIAKLRSGALAALLLAACLTHAQSREECERRHAPRIGEQGKDVIWVPTLDELAVAMLEAAATTQKDYVIDLGAGDGKIPIAAAKRFGARALGIEYNPQLVELARCNVQAEGLQDRVEIRQADIFATDFSDATVLTLYLLSDLNMRLRPTILAMKPGTRVVSNTFKMGDWSPDEFVSSEIGNTRAYLWYVPAQIAGTWRFREEGGDEAFRVQFRQRFQELEGDVLGSARQNSVRDATLRGAQLRFTVLSRGAALRLEGEVDGGVIRAVGERNGRRTTYVGERD